MPNQREVVSAGERTPDQARASELLVGHALARRQLLLKGLSKGGAAMAAVVPIQTLAASGSTILVTADNTLCTQSGQQSNVMSRTLTKVTCTGYAPGHYVTSTTPVKDNDWPSGMDSSTATFTGIFGGGDKTKLLYYLKNQPTSSQSYWIAAYFNATKAPTLPFPYTPTEVVAQYGSYANGSGSGLLNLYTKYLSSLA